MNNAPKVETLAQSVAALAGGFDEQRNLINEQIAGLSSQYGAQREAIEGTRSQQFNKINEQATGRGMAFSGIPLYEQTQYLANSYLPGLTNLANQENEERMKYRTNIAQLNSQQQQAALSRIDQQQAALNQWNLQQAQLAAQAEQARLDRQFEASQNAANRAAQAGGGGTSAYNTFYTMLQARTGIAQNAGNKDAYVSPATFNQLRSLAERNGMTAAEFNSSYKQFANPKDISGGYKAYGL
ncbi:hypothetical protein E6Q11_00755 [Candidatus Dojkabacteria bacterium]|uniref:Uncharacterized protein n=1 Tax=Candidatus Dojkabacteria bacterium TaxID=2099670 RepID=A0A5C7JAZ4_9BACT|nr:MAG: hypothetical protein E6Q11_00755 [Candidatus Dojkabacteria bacterium]